MKILGLMRVKNDAMWIEKSILSQSFCNHIIVLDGGSTDGTPDICRKLGAEVHVIPDRGFREGHDRETLAQMASSHNPDWISSLDGDEVFLPNTWETVRAALNDPTIPVIEQRNIQLWNNEQTVRVDGNWNEQFRQRLWRFKKGPLTYAPNNCALPNEIIERPFARIGALLHYGNMLAEGRALRHARNVRENMLPDDLEHPERAATKPLSEVLCEIS